MSNNTKDLCLMHEALRLAHMEKKQAEAKALRVPDIHKPRASDIALEKCDKARGIWQRHTFAYQAPKASTRRKARANKRARAHKKALLNAYVRGAKKHRIITPHDWDMTGVKPVLIPAELIRVKDSKGKLIMSKLFDGNRRVDDDMELRAMPYTSRLDSEIRQEAQIREHRNGDSAFDKRLFKRAERLRQAYQGAIGFAFHKAAFA